MRAGVMVTALILFAATASADVYIGTRDGKRVIYNVPSSGTRGGENLSWWARRHDRRSKFDPIIEKYARLYKLDPTLIRAVIQVESDFNPGRVSHKGARGLMQLIPATARRYGVKKIHDPEENIRGGMRYLSDLMVMFSSDLPRVLAAYNAGENAVIRYGGIPPYSETRTYVKRALSVYYGRPYGGAISFAGHRDGASLRGGFEAGKVGVAMLPGMRYLGSQ